MVAFVGPLELMPGMIFGAALAALLLPCSFASGAGPVRRHVLVPIQHDGSLAWATDDDMLLLREDSTTRGPRAHVAEYTISANAEVSVVAGRSEKTQTQTLRMVRASQPSLASIPMPPQTLAPEAPVPEVSSPEASAPEAPATEALAPEAPAPEAPAPEAPAPEAPAYEEPAPEAPAAEAPVPDAPAPEVSALVAPAPEATAPEAPAPKQLVPEASALEVTVLEADGAESDGVVVRTVVAGGSMIGSAVVELGGVEAALTQVRDYTLTRDVVRPRPLAEDRGGLAEVDPITSTASVNDQHRLSFCVLSLLICLGPAAGALLVGQTAWKCLYVAKAAAEHRDSFAQAPCCDTAEADAEKLVEPLGRKRLARPSPESRAVLDISLLQGSKRGSRGCTRRSVVTSIGKQGSTIAALGLAVCMKPDLPASSARRSLTPKGLAVSSDALSPRQRSDASGDAARSTRDSLRRASTSSSASLSVAGGQSSGAASTDALRAGQAATGDTGGTRAAPERLVGEHAQHVRAGVSAGTGTGSKRTSPEASVSPETSLECSRRSTGEEAEAVSFM